MNAPRFIPIDAPPWAYVAHSYLLAGWNLEEAAALVAKPVEELRRWFEEAGE